MHRLIRFSVWLVFLLLVSIIPVSDISADLGIPNYSAPQIIDQRVANPVLYYATPTPVPLPVDSFSSNVVVIIAGVIAVGVSAGIMVVMAKSA